MILYLMEQGSVLHISGKRLVVKKKGKNVAEYLLKDIEQIVIMGNIGLTTQTLRALLALNIDTVFTTLSGKYVGKLVTEVGKNIILRRKQFEKLTDDEFRMKVAREIVFAKLYNSREVLRKLNYYHKSDKVKENLRRLTVLIGKVNSVQSYEELLGIEGAGGKVYFDSFDYLITNTSMKFEKRTRRPPRNEFNSLLSFCYTLLLNIVRSHINTLALDPFMGAYHSIEYGKPSLALDLMEEFRPVAVDHAIINAVNKGVFTPSDFVREESDPDLPVKLTSYGRKKVVAVFERRMQRKFFYEDRGTKVKLREIIREQIIKFAKSLEERVDYKGFLFTV